MLSSVWDEQFRQGDWFGVVIVFGQLLFEAQEAPAD